MYRFVMYSSGEGIFVSSEPERSTREERERREKLANSSLPLSWLSYDLKDQDQSWQYSVEAMLSKIHTRISAKSTKQKYERS